MEFSEVQLWLKIIGSGLSGFGSIFLALRIKVILKWVTYSLFAHEQSIEQIINILRGGQQTTPTLTGVPKHLLNVQDKLGFILLTLGFVFLGLGMLCNMVSLLPNN